MPPHDSMAEKAVIGGILIDSGAVTEVAELLQPKHFYQLENKLIYLAILKLFDISVRAD